MQISSAINIAARLTDLSTKLARRDGTLEAAEGRNVRPDAGFAANNTTYSSELMGIAADLRALDSRFDTEVAALNRASTTLGTERGIEDGMILNGQTFGSGYGALFNNSITAVSNALFSVLKAVSEQELGANAGPINTAFKLSALKVDFARRDGSLEMYETLGNVRPSSEFAQDTINHSAELLRDTEDVAALGLDTSALRGDVANLTANGGLLSNSVNRSTIGAGFGQIYDSSIAHLASTIGALLSRVQQ